MRKFSIWLGVILMAGCAEVSVRNVERQASAETLKSAKALTILPFDASGAEIAGSHEGDVAQKKEEWSKEIAQKIARKLGGAGVRVAESPSEAPSSGLVVEGKYKEINAGAGLSGSKIAVAVRVYDATKPQETLLAFDAQGRSLERTDSSYRTPADIESAARAIADYLRREMM